MSAVKSIFSFKSISLRPRLACEIIPAGVVAARPGPGDREIVSAFAPLRPNIFNPGLKAPQFSDRGAVSSALRQALGEVAERDTKVTVIVPDASVRVLLLDFDTLPAKAADIPPIVRFRLRKLVPFDIEDAAVAYQTMPGSDGLVRLLVAVAPAPVLSEYESAVREAGYDPGVVLPSTLAALAAVEQSEPSLVVNRNGNSVTTAIARQNELLLHRTLELAEPGAPGPAEAEWLVAGERRDSTDELQQSVSVAIAYFEDTLFAPPRELLCCGLGGAEELGRLLGDSTLSARDLVPADRAGHSSRMPRGILAGVLGALAS